MTLLVAAVEGDTIWMISDTAITGGTIPLTKREYDLKIDAGDIGIVGFAGDHAIGRAGVRAAVSLQTVDEVLAHLRKLTADASGVEFAYAYGQGEHQKLVQIANGNAREVMTLFLGLPAAFDHFQRIRHRTELEPPPGEALGMTMIALKGNAPIPNGFSEALDAMLKLFAERQEHDVGGWATAYVLTRDQGPMFCAYSTSQTDPILDQLGYGDSIPHGTAEGGGYAMSVTELGEKNGDVHLSGGNSGRQPVYLIRPRAV